VCVVHVRLIVHIHVHTTYIHVMCSTIGGTAVCGTWFWYYWYHVPRTICMCVVLTMQLAIKYILLSFLFFLPAYRSTDTFLSCVNLVAHAVGRLLIDLDESFLCFPLLSSASLCFPASVCVHLRIVLVIYIVVSCHTLQLCSMAK